MGIVIPHIGGAASGLSTAESYPFNMTYYANCAVAIERLPTDPLFYATITLQNIVVGSRYWLAQASNLSNILAEGDAASTSVVLSSIPAYANPMLVEVRVRKGGTSPEYKPLKTYGYLGREGVSIYIAQTEDPIVT